MWKPLHPILKYLTPFRPFIYLGLFALIVSNMALVIGPLILKLAIDELKLSFSDSGEWLGLNEDQFVFYIWILLGLAVFQMIFRTLSRISVFSSARQIEDYIRQKLFNHLSRLPVSFYHTTSTGQLMASLTNDIGYIRFMLGFGTLFGLNLLISYAFTIPAIFRLNHVLAIMVMITYPVLYLSLRRLGKQIRQTSTENQDTFGDLTNTLNETFSSAREIKSYGAYEFSQYKLTEQADRYLDNSIRLVALRTKLGQWMQLGSGLGMVIVLGYGGIAVATGNMSLGELVAFSAFLLMLQWPTLVMAWTIPAIQRGLAAFDRLDKLFDQPQEAGYDQQHQELPSSGLHLQFKEVDFRYRSLDSAEESAKNKEREFSLRKIDFNIQPGEKILITGPTGSGKSTLLRLICRLHPIVEGSYLVNGRDAEQMDAIEVRRAISYCPQDAFVFSRTLRENILYAEQTKLNVDEAAAISALDVDHDQFPNGWETMVGEQGVTLSGGQRQRTALARAVAKRAPLLLLDDPIAQLDSKTATRVWQQTLEHFGDATVILVTQRAVQPESFDQIFFLDHGQIVERGKHRELVELKGAYYQQRQLQQLEGA